MPVALLTAVLAAVVAARATTITSDHSGVVNQTYDYVIAGGGLTGITVANKLSAAGNTVLIIEAGIDAENVEAVYNAELRGQLNGTCNWQYQAYNESKNPLTWKIDSGKCVGGSSSINGMVWYRPTQIEIDTLAALGNTGWGWSSLEPYMAAIEHNIAPTTAQIAEGAGENTSVHGYNGVVNVSFPTVMRIPYAQELYKTGIPEIFSGLTVTNDLSYRTNSVAASTSWTIWNDDVANITRRSSAAFALLYPASQQRSTLTVLTQHKVANVIFSGTTATGVKFGNPSEGTALYTVNARKEVLLASGALGSAPILERSGIGGTTPLAAAGVTQLVNLPGVGVNLVDQPGTGTSALVTDAWASNTSLIDGRNLFAPVIALPSIDQLFGTANATQIKLQMALSIPSRAQAMVDAGAAATLTGAITILTAMTGLISVADMPVVEFVGESYPAVMTAVFWPLLPQSRGYIHINSSDWTQDPIIVPRLLSDDYDVKFAVQVARKSRELFTSNVFAGIISDAYAAPANVGANATDDEYAAWFRETSYGASHWMGSTAMLPRAIGGVVDPTLKVYGTSKLRVIDAGILPLEITSHTMSTAYSIAQKAAALILAS